MDDQLIERLEKAIVFNDERALLVSNIKKPRTDNNYGRTAQLHEDSIAEIKRLQAIIEELEEPKF